MSLSENIMEKVPVKYRDIILDGKAILNSILNKRKVQELNDVIKKTDTSNWNSLNRDINIWIKSLKKVSLSTTVGLDIAKNFFSNDINIVKMSNITSVSKNSPILICVVKNDLSKIKEFYNHYRKIGIEKFAVLDNDSTDGTYEWLRDQPDTDLFRTTSKYTTNKRQSWINKLISYYGFNRWYIVVDSDELFVYRDMEQKSIQDLVEHAVKNQYKRIRTLTLDMYSKNTLSSNNEDSNYLDQYVYFDSDNYNTKNHYAFKCVDGGMRVRMFKGSNEEFGPYLTKYPLIYFEEGDLQYNSHYSLPIYKNFEDVCWGALLHYKFLGSDLKKYNEIAESGAFYGGSYEYKQYIKLYNDNPNSMFIHENSKLYEDSKSLRCIKEIEQIGW